MEGEIWDLGDIINTSKSKKCKKYHRPQPFKKKY